MYTLKGLDFYYQSFQDKTGINQLIFVKCSGYTYMNNISYKFQLIILILILKYIDKDLFCRIRKTKCNNYLFIN